MCGYYSRVKTFRGWGLFNEIQYAYKYAYIRTYIHKYIYIHVYTYTHILEQPQTKTFRVHTIMYFTLKVSLTELPRGEDKL